MPELYLSDLIKKTGWNLSRVKLIRHVRSRPRFQTAYKNNVIREYTQMQKPDFYKNTDYVLTFIGEEGTTAKFLACYKVTGKSVPLERKLFSEDFPSSLLNHPSGNVNVYHKLESTNYFEDFAERLLIDWGGGTVSWHQKASNPKPIIGISHSPKYTFYGYENVILTFEELKEIIDDAILYSEWHTALKTVHGIYLITQLDTGNQYIGSASGEDSLLQRWKSYIKTRDGGNKKIKELLEKDPEIYKNFQFSILQILPKTMTQSEVVSIENLHKKKLGSRAFGLNIN